MWTMISAATTLAVLVCAAGPAAAAGDRDPLARYRWTDRVLVALAPSRSAPALQEQRRIFSRMGSGARERDLVLVEGVDGTPEGAALRARFGGGAAFRAVLVGKDGGDKLTSDHPLGPDDLFPLIDAMPMRQDEMRRR